MKYDNEELEADECRIQYSMNPHYGRSGVLRLDLEILGLIVQGVEIPANAIRDDIRADLLMAVNSTIRMDDEKMSELRTHARDVDLDELADRRRKERLDTI